MLGQFHVVLSVMTLSQKGIFVNIVTHLEATNGGSEVQDYYLIRHMVNITLDHCFGYSNPIVVHCTKGIAATGTFIAFFQIRDDLYNPKYVIIFSCEDAAQQVLMSVCLCVCPSSS